ncbi:MAG: hypothetical protein P0Y53_20385 [Candidatus Pseudobacter hemicellulosilyticus]|uniref:Uncharacterized protein n=1 Tax=Candidatus Pseudobacter hemicellulosilyticus TaxID=3121375 RepID=A0AAJ5WQS6_9BACT|nr:MAG: hypothetical protein P0Y53_20385 [Pseudobacter sp.]
MLCNQVFTDRNMVLPLASSLEYPGRAHQSRQKPAEPVMPERTPATKAPSAIVSKADSFCIGNGLTA